MKILFLHGWASAPGGRKPTFLASHGHKVINPALPDDDFDAAALDQTEYIFDKYWFDQEVGYSSHVRSST